ncbi:universal stress protein UspA [Niabella ginsenosidivorans]|uniref:Universal stress protein UspA n=1 Tax=Niabella ginsenosidivorans TaxID=1176587 RepID=A0A1A9I005_9BACT|nr:universal stress protein [Niabella ginsenosidivorans]ANH80956.1 universal stress protein UspA [Niabella ginsenosidivorans]
MKKILVVTDFSDVADHAVDYACNLANKLNIEHLFLLNTYENIPIYDSGEAGSLALSMQEADELEQSRIESFQLLKQHLAHQLHTTTVLVPLIINDALPDAVNQVCREEDIDLVIIGIKRQDDLETLILGSNIRKAVDRIHYPVLLIPRCASIAVPQNVILAAPFREPLTRAIQIKLHKFLYRFNGKVTAIHRCIKGALNEKESKIANELQLQLQHYNCPLQIIKDVKDLPAAINEYASNNSPSLVISIHKMRGFIAGLFHKSVTKSLAWRCDVPLLVLHM